MKDSTNLAVPFFCNLRMLEQPPETSFTTDDLTLALKKVTDRKDYRWLSDMFEFEEMLFGVKSPTLESMLYYAVNQKAIIISEPGNANYYTFRISGAAARRMRQQHYRETHTSLPDRNLIKEFVEDVNQTMKQLGKDRAA